MPNQKEFAIGFLWDGPPNDQEANINTPLFQLQ